MDGHAVTRKDIPAVIIQEGRNKMHLDVGPIVSSVLTDDETTCFSNIRAARTFTPKEIAQTHGDVVHLIIANRKMSGHQCANIQVILQVLAHSLQFVLYIDINRS